MHRMLTMAAMALILPGCMHMTAAGETGGQLATAVLRFADGTAHGRATLLRTSTGVRLLVDGDGLPPGSHGLHIHAVGKCDAPDFKSAGAHWNPTMKMHGRDNPMGAHSGDLPNLVIGSDGHGTVSADVVGDPSALMDADGASVIVHAGADDYKTDPSGNSGDRIACGIFSAT